MRFTSHPAQRCRVSAPARRLVDRLPAYRRSGKKPRACRARKNPDRVPTMRRRCGKRNRSSGGLDTASSLAALLRHPQHNSYRNRTP